MEVRVRYAPSPTGFQHIGGVRTALFNYLFAKANGGKFILRVEDTDRTRYSEEFEKNLYDTLDWLGIDWDEGGTKGGDYGPYVQSERFEMYKEYAQKLVDSGAAYYCFCDSERLERIRKIRTMNKMPPGYDRECRNLTESEVKEKLDAGVPYVIRLKIPLEGTTTFHDSILGDIEWKNEDINPDPVLLKSDGFPTYHLANIIDDHFMKITHIMRAQEWLPSAPLHVILYKAFGWEPPKYCHLPMVMGNDGLKLSKRHGASSCNDFRNKGYLKEAIINYVAMLGCSYEEGQEVYTLEELGRLFSVEHLNKAPAVFDYKKLDWFNGQYIRQKTDEELFDLTWGFIANSGLLGEPETVDPVFKDVTTMKPTEEQRSILMKAMPLIKERLHFLTEAPEMLKFLFVTPSVAPLEDFIPKKLNAEQVKEVLMRAKNIIPQLEGLGEQEGFELFKPEGEAMGVKMGDFMMPVRVAVTGGRVSPPLVGSIQILGIDEAVKRIEVAIKERFE
ncbi:MAG: glutamate--tRNA ligase [Treponema sp.]|nr:MAG: glutamate--tRNA ligase [Treponema sp.]